jgi:aspartyl-tRNA synthetase
MCGEVTENFLQQKVLVCGWVHKRRNLGSLIFISLRDRTGLVQIIVNQEQEKLFAIAESLRPEFVIEASGVVAMRKEKDFNLELNSGKIEILAEEIKIFSESETPPFQILDLNVKEDLRLKYRYLDLRRPELQKNFFVRHKIMQSVREFMNQENFLEIETPILTKSTPEGARDYLVPSRIHVGEFYALPQSPQLFKQLLMIAGFDRYFQIAKCFRDEDLRADRQPEFTQIDMELSFCEVDDIISLNEKLIKKIFLDILNINLVTPFKRLTYKEALERFGSDKPDTRFDLELKNLSYILKDCNFDIFKNAIDDGGSVRGFKVEDKNFSRRQIDKFTQFIKEYKANFLSNIVINQDGTLKSSLQKFLSDDELQKIILEFKAKPGDFIFICADSKNKIVFDALGNLRIYVAKQIGLISENDCKYNFLWVTDFPMFEWSEEEKRYVAMHHPFTAPLDEDIKLLDNYPDRVRAKAYDIILNGVELGGGSLRIYNKSLQKKIFDIIGLDDKEIYDRFGFFLEAFKYGAPPHGGLAYGLDRFVMLLINSDYIRDVIAFPKTKEASCLLTAAPSKIGDEQLKELNLKVLDAKIKKEGN